MPWKVTCPMDERMKFVVDWQSQEYCVAELCRIYGISRPTAYKWWARYQTEGLEGFRDRSRAPKHHPHAVAEPVEQRILAARRAHPTWGPKKLRASLSRQDPRRSWPACSTIGEILKRHGLTVPRKRRRRTPPHTEPFSACDGPNTVWCADFKGWFRTGDGTRCDPLTITDAYSRFLLRCQAGTRPTLSWTRGWFEAAFRQYGLPHAIRTDNGTPFASRGVGGFSKLSVWWVQLGIVPERIEPAQPQQNGRHERMHLTLKREAASPPARTLRAQQRHFDRFRREYNEDRPHEALDMATPASLYSPSERELPGRLQAMSYPRGIEQRVVQKKGQFYWRTRDVFLGEAFVGQRVGLQPLESRYWLVYFGRYPLGVFDSHSYVVVHGRKAVRLCVRLGFTAPPEGSFATLASLLAERRNRSEV